MFELLLLPFFFIPGELPSPSSDNSHLPELPAPMESSAEYHHYLVGIPAPRGLIVDRRGRSLAENRSGYRLALRMRAFDGDAVAGAGQLISRIEEWAGFDILRPSERELSQHWEYRSHLPLPITGRLSRDSLDWLHEHALLLSPLLTLIETRERFYPDPSLAHVVGYCGMTMPDQHGPWVDGQLWWPRSEGRRGLEASQEAWLAGKPGLVSLLYDDNGIEVNREILRTPVPGHTVVTTLDREMQEEATRALAESERSGAIVALDAETGDILTMASLPAFDPNDFIPSIHPDRYRELRERTDGALYHRAVSASYPPGSVFKPIAALGILSSYSISSYTRFDAPSQISIDGRIFRNWNKDHEGGLDVTYALLRSANTWFYQAAIRSGDKSLLKHARWFGLGQPPRVPLDAVAAGNLPEKVPSSQGLANLSIGQGAILVSPLQVAKAMTGFANETYLTEPRLILQIQAPLTHEIVESPLIFRQRIRVSATNMETVQAGMWGVVNHPRGTGGRAALEKVAVHGKTGTAQWSRDGSENTAAWFSGFVDSESPRIAFATIIEGREGESLSGGRNAAPVIRQFLAAIYDHADDFLVQVPDAPFSAPPEIRSPDRRSARGNDSFHRTGYSSDRHRSASRTSSHSRYGTLIRERPPRRRGLLSRLFGD